MGREMWYKLARKPAAVSLTKIQATPVDFSRLSALYAGFGRNN